MNELAKEIHENAKSKGFYEEKREVGTLLMLVVSELSEALEADRKNNRYSDILDVKKWFVKGMADKDYGHTFNEDSYFKHQFETYVKDTFEDELADSIIRILDICGYMDIDIENHIKAKMRYNELRQKRHGKNY